MQVIDKRSKKIYKVYDIRYDSSCYPHFLIYMSGAWVVASAKHFEPIIEIEIDDSEWFM